MNVLRWAKWMVGALAVSISGLSLASGGDGFPPASPDELKMTSEPLAPGAPAIILYRQVDRLDGSYSSGQEDIHFRIKILTEEGRKYANVEIPFLKEYEDIVNIHARTIRPDGSIADFGGKVFEKTLYKQKFQGIKFKYLAKTFTLTDVQVGSILEYSYTRNSGVRESEWVLNDELFTKKARFSLEPYRAMALRWSYWNPLPSGATPPTRGADHIIRMEANNIPAFETEDFMPPNGEVKSHVTFIYYEESASTKNEAAYWKDLGKTANWQLENFVGKKKAMEQAVAQIVAPSDSPEVKLRKIYDRVQKFRNTSYEVERTEQELKRVKEKVDDKANVEDVWKRGYGNGSQLTWLFLGLARAAGFEAYGCLVSDRRNHFFNPASMQGEKLDSNVVLVKLDGKESYFDPGGAFTPFGLLSWSETGVQGLRLDKDGGGWIKTTLPQAAESRIEHRGKLELSDTGELEGKIAVSFVGLESMGPRLEERNLDEVARKKFLEEYLASQIVTGSEVELTNQPDWSNSEAPLVAEFNLKIPGWAASTGRRAVIPAAIFTSAEKGVFEHSTRVHPIYFEYPHQKIEDVTIDLPAGWRVNSVPKNQDIDAKAAAYELKVEPSAGTLHLTRKLTIDMLLLDTKYYPSLRSFFQGVRNGDAQQVVLQPGEVHASN